MLVYAYYIWYVTELTEKVQREGAAAEADSGDILSYGSGR